MTKNASKNLIGLGLFLLFGVQFASGTIDEGGEPGTLLAAAIITGAVVGLISYIAGLGFYAKAKGQPLAWGMSGLLCIVGGIAVAFLKDKSSPNT